MTYLSKNFVEGGIYKFNGFREDIVSYIEDERQKDAEQGNSEHKSSSRDFVMK